MSNHLVLLLNTLVLQVDVEFILSQQLVNYYFILRICNIPKEEIK